MKVLHLLDGMNRGGTEMLVLEICKNAKINELDIFFIATRGGEMAEDFKKTDTHFIHIQRKFPIDFFLIFKLRNIIKKNSIPIIHTHQAVDALHVFFAKIGLKTKLFYTFHGFDYEYDLKNRIIIKFLISKVDSNIFVSEHLKTFYLKKYKPANNSNVVIYNGITGDNKNYKKYLKKEIGTSESSILIGMIANFYYTGRDQLTVCKALSKVFVKNPEVRFVFVGARFEKRPHLFDECVNYCKQNNISDKVHFLGIRSDIKNILADLDIFVFSSYIDTFGIAIIEAMRAGLPVVLNDYPPFMEISDNGKYASIFKTKDPDDLAEKLIELIENPDKRKKLGHDSKKWADSNFDISVNIARSKELYQKLLDGSSF